MNNQDKEIEKTYNKNKQNYLSYVLSKNHGGDEIEILKEASRKYDKKCRISYPHSFADSPCKKCFPRKYWLWRIKSLIKKYMNKIIIVLVVLFSFNLVSACDPTSTVNNCEIVREVPRDEIKETAEQTPEPTPEPTTEPVQEIRHKKTGSYLRITKPQYVWDVIKFGDKGENVKVFQMVLNNHGAKLKVDGIYGLKTHTAWLNYEKLIK
jgi:hypothetical protein